MSAVHSDAAAFERVPVAASYPLVVDLDGTLTPTDTLVESLIKLIKRSPFTALQMPIWLLRGRMAFKNEIASRVRFSAQHLPYRAALIDHLVEERRKGRRLVLATAAHKHIALAVAEHLRLFDLVLASDGVHNLKGVAKLERIQREVGADFAYAGDSAADLPIWHAAQSAILIEAPSRIADRVRQAIPVEFEIRRRRPTFKVLLRAIRVHQWLKNVLLFVPLLTGFTFTDYDSVLAILAAFVAFSLAASATYMVNDLWDLDSDRAHPRKCHRPFASAALPITSGLAIAGSALLVALAIAASVSLAFLAMLVTYLVLTSAYSWTLKQYVLVDVLMLSLLYTLRIVAGAMAIGVQTSSWMLAFSVFMFLSLALVKRCSELVSLDQLGREATSGRDYRVSDLTVLWPFGVGAALSSVVVLGLFISAWDTQARYATPNLLWLVAVGLIYWLGRLWIKTARGEMHDDPIVYAIRDRGSRYTVAMMTCATLAAHFVDIGPIG